MNAYAQYNAARFYPTDSTAQERKETRDEYQMHTQRYTQAQLETAARLASGLSFA